jgi:predicted metal-binding membrane protein
MPMPLLLRQNVLMLSTLLLTIGVAWAYLIWMAGDVAAGSGFSLAHCAAMPGMTSSSVAYASWLFVMWAVMAVAMMLPTALPFIVLFGRFWRSRNPAIHPNRATFELMAGYLSAWIFFGILAAALQFGLEQTDMLTPMLGGIRNLYIGGVVLIGAGLFQLTPLKSACLTKCRSPLMFIMTRWREGRRGPFLMGLDHGIFCLGCCWALMLVMFVAGVMNLMWMAALTVIMLLEKVVRRGDLLSRGAGAALLVAGCWMLIHAWTGA